MKNVNKLTKTLTIAVNVLVYVLCALCLLLLLFTVFGKRNSDGAVQLFGYEMRVVLSGSMEKNQNVDVSDYKIKDIKTGSLVFVRLVPNDQTKAQEFYANLQVGDVLTFCYDVSSQRVDERTAPHMTITHRIVSIEPNDTGGYIITLRGDNLATGFADEQIINTSDIASPNYVIGKVTGKSYVLGRLAYSLKRPMGIAMLIIIPSVIILIWQVVKIVSVLKDKNKKQLVQTSTDNPN